MTATHPVRGIATRMQISDSSEPRRPVRLSLSSLTPARAVTLRIQALAGAIASAIAMYLLASLYEALRGWL